MPVGSERHRRPKTVLELGNSSPVPKCQGPFGTETGAGIAPGELPTPVAPIAGAGGSGAEPLRCGRSHDCPPSVRQSPSQAPVAGDFSFKQSRLSLSPFPPDLPPSQGVCPRGTASSALRLAGSRVPTGCPQGARSPAASRRILQAGQGQHLGRHQWLFRQEFRPSFISKPCSLYPP